MKPRWKAPGTRRFPRLRACFETLADWLRNAPDCQYPILALLLWIALLGHVIKALFFN